MPLVITPDNATNTAIISGDTYHFKEYIKSVGGKWNPVEKVWRVPLTADLSCLQPRPYVHARPYWLCCDKAEIIDFKRKHSACREHAHDGNTFRVGGNIYTGD